MCSVLLAGIDFNDDGNGQGRRGKWTGVTDKKV